jgi:hypothetical protein
LAEAYGNNKISNAMLHMNHLTEANENPTKINRDVPGGHLKANTNQMNHFISNETLGRGK